MTKRNQEKTVALRLACTIVMSAFLITIYLLSMSVLPGFSATATPSAAQKELLPLRKVAPSMSDLSQSGSQLPAASDDLMGIRISPTGAGAFDVTVEYAAADHSDTILLAARPVKDGQYAAGGYVPTPISPGKGEAVVKMNGVYDPFDQLEVYMYLKTDQSVIVKKRFNDYANAITSVQITQKTPTEYAVGVTYSLSSASSPGAFIGAIPLKNGEMSGAFTGNTPVPAKAGKYTAVVAVRMNSSSPAAFDQMKAAIFNSGSDIVTKTVDYGSPSTPASAKDEISSFQAANQGISSLDFSVGYAYQSNQNGNVIVSASVLNGGYPIDWIKCSQDYAQKGNGTASLKCSLASTQTMPQGIQSLQSDQIRVQLVNESGATPLATRTFPLARTWSIDDLSNFRVTGQSGSAITFLVDYVYGSSHGALVGITAKAKAGGASSTSVFPASDLVKKGSGTAAGKFPVPANGKPIDEVYVYMYESAGQDFYSETFPYAAASGLSPGSAATLETNTLSAMDKTAVVDKTLEPAAASGLQTGRATVSRQVADAAFPAVFNLAAQAVSPREIRLKWSRLTAGLKEYRIERKDAGMQYAVIATIGPAGAEYLDSEVKPASTYAYRVQAVPETKDASVVSNEVIVKTPSDMKKMILTPAGATRKLQ